MSEISYTLSELLGGYTLILDEDSELSYPAMANLINEFEEQSGKVPDLIVMSQHKINNFLGSVFENPKIKPVVMYYRGIKVINNETYDSLLLSKISLLMLTPTTKRTNLELY